VTKWAILYTRVSTDEQAEQSYSLQTQLEELRHYCQAQDLVVAGELAEDFTGTRLDRPALNQARERLRAGEAEAIVFHTADRMSRKLAHSLLLREEFQRLGIELHTINRGRSENTSEGRMTENIDAVFAEYWREKIIEGSRRGRRGKAAAGKWVGTGHVPFGYRAEGPGRDKHLVIDPAESAVVHRIYALYLGRGGALPLSAIKIARLLECEGVPTASTGKRARGWYDSTVKRILSSRVYVGEFHYGPAVATIHELALVDLATFEAVRARAVLNRKRSARSRKVDYLLSGHAVCACGSRLVGFSSRATYTYYHCTRKTHLLYLPPCSEPSQPHRKVDNLVWDWLVKLLKDEEAVRLGLARMDERDAAQLRPTLDYLALIDDTMARANRQTERLAADLRALESDQGRAALRTEINALGKQIQALKVERVKQRAIVDREALSRADRALILERARAIREELDLEQDFETKRFFLDRLNLEARLWRDEHNLRWLHVTCGLGEDELPLKGRFDCRAG
jgi:site-specific DNA recombinase